MIRHREIFSVEAQALIELCAQMDGRSGEI